MENNPKPIVLIKIGGFLTQKQLINYDKSISAELKIDYHVLIVNQITKPIDYFEMKVFYEKDFNQVKYDELKQIIENGFATRNTNEN